jgi:hypothetical protein
MKKVADKIITGLFCIYLFGWIFVFFPYNNFQYIRTNGFAKWIFGGEMIASAQSFAWPYFIYTKWESYKSTKNMVVHFSKAINYKNMAARIFEQSDDFQIIPPSDMGKAVVYYRKALAEGKKADIKIMNELYAGFGDHFEGEFIKGLELFLQSYEDGDAMAAIVSQGLLMRFGDWYKANIDNIKSRVIPITPPRVSSPEEDGENSKTGSNITLLCPTERDHQKLWETH